jgi:hypothetical protein
MNEATAEWLNAAECALRTGLFISIGAGSLCASSGELD